ncbi:Nudix family hydrolase [Burkholderiaceae bacterium DAT-1]|nr:Nudix family hydrolase [Burkholderiaceae bacterium DAT-1]
MNEPVKITHVSAGILIRPDGTFLLASRPEGKPYAGWWEFPGGKLEAGETPLEALTRELQEELGIMVTAATPWVVQTFTYPHATVRLNFFKVTAWEGELQSHEGQSFAWQVPGATTADPILPANAPILRGLQLSGMIALSNAVGLGTDQWLQQLDAALARGLKLLVLREPQLDAVTLTALAEAALTRCRAYHARLIVHGDIELAARLGADGVHLSSRMLADMTVKPAGWVGASVHNEVELAHAARLGLDYAVLGHVAATPSHAELPPLGWDRFTSLIAQGWPVPVYAIGGMRDVDVQQAIQCGGQGIAMLSAAWQYEGLFI